MGILMGLSDEEIARGVAAYETVGRRGAVLETGYLTLIDDSYNANPDSVACGIDSLAGAVRAQGLYSGRYAGDGGAGERASL